MTRRTLRVRSMWPAIGLLVGVASVVHGEEIRIIVPNAYENAEAPDSAETGFSPNVRAQLIFAADQFAKLPTGGAYLVSFRWRPDGGTSSPADLSVNEMTWSASVTWVAPDSMSLCFADNITGPVAVVRAPAFWEGHTDNLPAGGGSKVFDIKFALDTPYHYEPAEGKNLLLDGVVFGSVFPVNVDRLVAGERSQAALLVRGDPADPCALPGGYVGSIVTEFTFCPTLEGACCLPDATCAEAVTSAACTELGGTFQGLCTTCGDGSSCRGACCLPDGTCAETPAEATCTELGGTFGGLSTTCGDGSICLGACCKGSIGCSETLINECADNFRGYGSTCAQGCPCPDPFADADLDGDVDQDDFAAFQACFAGPYVTVSGICLCFDRYPAGAPDGHVDSLDLWKFELCASGPGIPLNAACDTW